MASTAEETDSKKTGFSDSSFPPYCIALIKEAAIKHTSTNKIMGAQTITLQMLLSADTCLCSVLAARRCASFYSPCKPEGVKKGNSKARVRTPAESNTGKERTLRAEERGGCCWSCTASSHQREPSRNASATNPGGSRTPCSKRSTALLGTKAEFEL